MRKLQKIVLFTALLGAGTLAFAGPEHPEDRHAAPNADPSAQPVRELAGAIRRLDLDPEQETAIKEIFAANREALEAQAAAGRDLREELQTLLNEPELDEEALAALAAAEGDLAEERVMLIGTLAAEVLAELDDEQRAELATLRAERLSRRDEWREKKRAERPARPGS